MAEESDGIEEAFEGQLRVLITAAGQIAERVARAREEALRRGQAASEQEARELASRLAAEQRAARTELAGVYRSDWWDQATPEQIGHTYQVARAWSGEDPEAVRAEVRMRDELRTRYGIDVDNPSTGTGPGAGAVWSAMERADPSRSAVGATTSGPPGGSEIEQARAWFAQHDPELLSRWQQQYDYADTIDGRRSDERDLVQRWRGRTEPERAKADAERARAAAENVQAQLLMQQADREDAHTATQYDPNPGERTGAAVEPEQREASVDRARADAHALYDSAERRDSPASDLEAIGIDTDVVAIRRRADASQAKPATEAVKTRPAVKNTKAGKTREPAAPRRSDLYR